PGTPAGGGTPRASSLFAASTPWPDLTSVLRDRVALMHRLARVLAHQADPLGGRRRAADRAVVVAALRDRFAVGGDDHVRESVSQRARLQQGRRRQRRQSIRLEAALIVL